MPNCAVPSCKRFPSEGHHITYNPPLVVGLCAIHHREITRVNQNFAQNPSNWEKLTSGERRTIWDGWLERKIKEPHDASCSNWNDYYRIMHGPNPPCDCNCADCRNIREQGLGYTEACAFRWCMYDLQREANQRRDNKLGVAIPDGNLNDAQREKYVLGCTGGYYIEWADMTLEQREKYGPAYRAQFLPGYGVPVKPTRSKGPTKTMVKKRLSALAKQTVLTDEESAEALAYFTEGPLRFRFIEAVSIHLSKPDFYIAFEDGKIARAPIAMATTDRWRCAYDALSFGIKQPIFDLVERWIDGQDLTTHIVLNLCMDGGLQSWRDFYRKNAFTCETTKEQTAADKKRFKNTFGVR